MRGFEVFVEQHYDELFRYALVLTSLAATVAGGSG